MMNTILIQAFIITVGLSGVAAAAAPNGYPVDADGKTVKDGNGGCVHSGSFTPAMAVQGCVADGEGKLVQDDYGCNVYDWSPDKHRTFIWHGSCVNGQASGYGTLEYFKPGGTLIKRVTGTMDSRAFFSGKAAIVFMGPTVVRQEGELGSDGLFKGKVHQIKKYDNGCRVETNLNFKDDGKFEEEKGDLEIDCPPGVLQSPNDTNEKAVLKG